MNKQVTAHTSGLNKKSNLYLPNLNGLRFIAAFMVFVCHTEIVKSNYYLPYCSEYFFTLIGKLGVVLFFVISGFLITFLLLKEESETNDINIKKFYIRRMLRIWPLYFLIVIFSFFLAPEFTFFYIPNFESSLTKGNFLPQLFSHLILFPNFSISLFGVIPYAGHLWSVGAEEQFYLLWPLLIKKVKNRLKLFIAVFFFYSAAKIVLLFFVTYSPLAKIILGFWYYFNIDCMAIGAVAAYLVLYNKQKILSLIYSKFTQIFTYLILLLLIGNGYLFKIFHYEIYGMLFAILVLNLACNKKSVLNLEFKLFNFLGKISYGIYMYHFIALTIAIKVLQNFNFLKGFAIYTVGFFVTLLLSTLSYYLFELPFLKKKEQYSIFGKSKKVT